MTAYVATERADTVTRLRTAIAASVSGDPLYGLLLPDNRHERPAVDPAHPVLFVSTPRIGRAAVADTAPAFRYRIDLVLELLVVSAMTDAAGLDARVDAIWDVIDGVLLEDAAWVARWSEIESGDIETEDVEHQEWAARVSRCTFVVTAARVFNPRVTDDFTALGNIAPDGADPDSGAFVVVGPVAGGAPGENHVIKIDAPVEGP